MAKIKQKDIDFILTSGEGLKVEFKESPNHIDRTMVAFANAEGGKIYIGINDHKKIVGLNITNDLRSQIQNIARNCDSQINISMEIFKRILIVEVKEGVNKPYKCKDGFFMRIGPNSQKMSRNEIIDLIIKEGRVFFDDHSNSRCNIKKEFNPAALKRFLNLAGVTTDLPSTDILLNLGAAEKQGNKIHFKNGGILFFAKDPQKYLRYANMTCVAFKDKEGVAALDRKDLSGNLLDIVSQAENFVERNTRTGFRIKGFKRENLPDYPIEAIREGFVNALMHRDYFEKGANVLLKIFPDKIVIDNPGGLVKGITLRDLGKKSRTRNPLIADLFYRVNLAERIGSGIKRMSDLMRQHGLRKPKIEVNDGFFTIIFHGPKQPEAVIPEIAKLSERQKHIIRYIQKKGRITTSSCSDLLKVSNDTALRELLKLKKKKIIKSNGIGRSMHYTLA
ncbi:MAG: helix-turn-helix domain-containing protein [Candidatus Margulisbacteria bacterium]|nr:helix-turn-helix domain-containing protein [Candidatus Margulisiibacteriota bacterium]MBU1021793.1 helix-turn-helix domain-containing protein [Candidatus Margulisiibacteriota bacterium]MBU1729539.1 helix-turn-helix domain-containing protein [Candidatus Margulisiibacteriota bacterium]MBU1955360.1 helix-turn-helix domain-containing protein [Candidatus Margulisiibacteriota bacterium]